MANKSSVELWVERLEEVLNNAPEGVWLSADDCNIYAMGYNENGERALLENGVADPEQSALTTS